MIRRNCWSWSVDQAAILAVALGFLGLAFAADVAQSASPRRVGVVLNASSPEQPDAQAFRLGLQDAGYSEGRDVVIEWRPAYGDYSRLPRLIADLVESKVDVIVVESTPATRIATRMTSTIPIVMAIVADPVGSGLVASLGHPGGNVTGLSFLTVELGPKRLQLLKEAVPRLSRVAVLWNSDTSYHRKVSQDLKAAAPSLSIDLSFADVTTPAQFESAFSKIRAARAQALYVIEDGLFLAHAATINELALKARLPTVSALRRVVEDGGFMSYGPSYGDLFRLAAGYVDKILRGAKPGDLPVQQPTRFELVVNMSTAEALDLTIPRSILQGADEVIR